MKRFLMAAALGVMVSLPAVAAPLKIDVPVERSAKCYYPAEIEAESAVRIHSELMIIGLNCQRSRFTGTHENTYNIYRQFTADHAKPLVEYEARLLGYFKRTGAKNPSAALNDMRTAFANKISLDAAKTRPDMFCYQYAPRLQKVKTMSDDQFRQWAATPYAGHPPTRPACQAK